MSLLLLFEEEPIQGQPGTVTEMIFEDDGEVFMLFEDDVEMVFEA